MLQICSLEALNPAFEAATTDILAPVLGNVDSLHVQLWLHLQSELNRATSMDSPRRFVHVMKCLQPTVLSFASSSARNDAGLVSALFQWTNSCTGLSLRIFHANRDAYLIHPDPKDFLGSAASRMYGFVRQELKVPFQNRIVPEALTHNSKQQAGSDTVGITGSFISRIYVALRNGERYVPVIDCLREVLAESRTESGSK